MIHRALRGVPKVSVEFFRCQQCWDGNGVRFCKACYRALLIRNLLKYKYCKYLVILVDEGRSCDNIDCHKNFFYQADKLPIEFGKWNRFYNCSTMIDEPISLEEIGEIYNISRERVRQIEESALKKLKLKITRDDFVLVKETLVDVIRCQDEIENSNEDFYYPVYFSKEFRNYEISKSC